MRMMMIILGGLLILMMGCENLLPEVEEPVPEGPQTKAEVLAKIRPAIAPLRNTLQPGMPGISDHAREQVMSDLREAIMAYGDTEFGQEALRELGYEIMDIARQAAGQTRHNLVLVCVDAIELLSMESHLLRRLGERADIFLDRPMVRVQGFLDDHEKDDTYVFLQLIDRRTGSEERVKARLEDKFHNLRLVDIIGRNRGVVLEYLRVPGLLFEVEAFR